MENKSNAAAIISEWNELTAQDQVSFITNCIFRAMKDYPIGSQHEINELVNETWLRISGNMAVDRLDAIDERRAAQGKAPTTLVGIVYRAARASIAAANYSEQKHAVANVRTVKGADAESSDYTDTMAASLANTEATAILKTTLENFAASRDKIDQQIISGMMNGLTERELAAIVHISAPAVHKRIAKIRATLQTLI